MADTWAFDELNIADLTGNQRSVPYELYFGEMELGNREKEKRTELAQQLEIVFLTTFALIFKRQYTFEQAWRYLRLGYQDTISNFFKPDYRLKSYIRDISQDIVNTTIKNIGSEYYASYDRAVFIAENEANSTMNYLQYAEAVESGKVQKEWIDIRDHKERETHRKVGGIINPINEPFEVGSSLMMYPKDSSLGAEAGEIINCRCSIIYS